MPGFQATVRICITLPTAGPSLKLTASLKKWSYYRHISALLTTLDSAHSAATKIHGIRPAGSCDELRSSAASSGPKLPHAFASSQACLPCPRRHPRQAGSRSVSPQGTLKNEVGKFTISNRCCIRASPQPTMHLLMNSFQRRRLGLTLECEISHPSPGKVTDHCSVETDRLPKQYSTLTTETIGISFGRLHDCMGSMIYARLRLGIPTLLGEHQRTSCLVSRARLRTL